ncbi:hypothetical protein KC19_VG288500 [Ceratodon purpureus]|uniref:Uncharacterized protein n=1 Tax=Ceratodon purpureus TaxID=3225 RepID=A0A8T0HVK7_CERPU|nr:hypothetical protein KC19_VG288500 [Ceratodon purpureus]
MTSYSTILVPLKSHVLHVQGIHKLAAPNDMLVQLYRVLLIPRLAALSSLSTSELSRMSSSISQMTLADMGYIQKCSVTKPNASSYM